MNGRDDPSTLVSYVEVFSLSDSYALWKSRRSPETKPDGRDDRTRTCGLTVPNRTLYQLSYVPTNGPRCYE